MYRFFYASLKLTLPYTLRVFYPRNKVIGSPNERCGRTIYVSNHAASFMDPLIVASFRKPIVFFMTRSDVFTPVTRPILWAAHMFPIYRQHDGGKTKDKNEEVFQKCAKILDKGRNMLIFGEGFTDDIFVRRLKPLKKGAARMGFTALEENNWSKDIYICAVGVNYSDPNEMRSDLLLSTGKKIRLNDFKERYLTNPNHVINEVTALIDKDLKNQLTHIEDIEMCPFHENVMKITRKGMNARCSDTTIPLEDRWRYSQNLAKWFNANVTTDNAPLMELRKELNDYFALEKKLKVDEKYFFPYMTNPSTFKEILFLVTMWPFMLLGMFHCGPLYFIIKKFVEKSFKRAVFHGSVKLLLAKISMGLVNIPIVLLMSRYIFSHIPGYQGWMGFLYYAAIGLFGLAAYMWFRNLHALKEKKKYGKMKLTGLWEKRKALYDKIKQLIPVA